MDSVRERIARAMAEERGWVWDKLTDEPQKWDDIDEGKNWWRKSADAVLAELRKDAEIAKSEGVEPITGPKMLPSSRETRQQRRWRMRKGK